MTPKQLENKLDELNFWLDNNQSHEHYSTKYNERNELVEQLTQ
ncbi:hypothetical protein [Bizionia argentinensis]|nr:hypothetical protein [Bizionia argentinensis]